MQSFSPAASVLSILSNGLSIVSNKRGSHSSSPRVAAHWKVNVHFVKKRKKKKKIEKKNSIT